MAKLRPLPLGIRRGITWAALVAIVIPCSCATKPVPRSVPLQDLSCNRNEDCEIVEYDVVAEDCCGARCCTEPYAISTAAVERHRTSQGEICVDAECTLEGCWCLNCCTRGSDWIAVCIDHACKRRSPTFFSSPELVCPKGH